MFIKSFSGLFCVIYSVIYQQLNICLSFSLPSAVIIWVYPLLWSQISCSCYIASEWKTSVSTFLKNLCWFDFVFLLTSIYVIFRFGQPIKVNWAYASGQREDTSGWYSFCVCTLMLEIGFCNAVACVSMGSVSFCCNDVQVTSTYLWVISALRLQTLHCLPASLFILVVRKLHIFDPSMIPFYFLGRITSLMRLFF